MPLTGLPSDQVSSSEVDANVSFGTSISPGSMSENEFASLVST